MNLLQTIRTIEEVAKGIPNVHTVVSAFEDLNREDTVYSAVIIQQQSHTHNDDWMQYNFYIGYADRLVEDGSNELSVQSTAMNTIHSIVRALRNILPSAEISYSNTNVFTQIFTALCAGAYETVSIILPISECDDSNEGIPGLDTLSTTITENGDYNFIPDGLGFDSVHVVVDVQPEVSLEERSISINENGPVVVTTTPGFTGMSKVNINVAVPQAGYKEGYDEGYSKGHQEGVTEGYADGVAAQKSKLQDITITENGTYDRVDGYKHIVVNVPASAEAEGHTININENGTFTYTPQEGVVWNSITVIANVPTEGGYQEGYEAGYAAGHEAGYTEGYTAGHTAGKTEGIAEQKAKLASVEIVANGTYEKEDGYNRVVVNVESPVVNLQEKTTNPTTTAVEVTPDPEFAGLSKVTVNPVDSNIDPNIVPENIKTGVTVLGVEGTLKEEKPEEVFDVQPSITDQTITPNEGSVFSRGTVRAVTADIDNNIVSNNIREGVTILGVEGTLKEVKPEERFNVQPSTVEQTITPTEGKVFSGGTVKAVTSNIDKNIVSNNIKEGVSILGVEGTLKEVKPEERFNVQPTTSDQTITPREGYTFSGGTVKAVTSSIDVNIVSDNIKEGVTILGVEGSHKGEKPEETFNVQPSTVEQTITPTEGKVFSGGTVKAVTSSIDSNIQPENIKQGVAILGIVGTLSESGGGDPDYRYMSGGVDRNGLRTLGWTEEDILRYEQNTPHYPWQNDLYTVSEENKALYGLDDPNPVSYKDDQTVTFVPNKKMDTYFNSGTFEGMKYIKGLPFYNCTRTDITRMFKNCSSLTTIPLLNTSNVTNMSNMFYGCSNLTTIPLLNTSNVTDMHSMFEGCSSLTTTPQLDTSNVTSMGIMFCNCTSLTTIPLLNTSNVTGMGNMFSNCTSLTSIPLFNTSNVTSMNYMFDNCQQLATIPILDTSNVTDMEGMFKNCTSLTSIHRFNTSKVTNMGSMFYNCRNLNGIPKLDTSNVTDMSNMLYYCRNLTAIPQLDTSNVTFMGSMFYHCDGLTTIPQLNTSNVIDMRNMFESCSSLTTIPQLDTSKVTKMDYMFDHCSSLTTIPQLNTSNVTKMDYMFASCIRLTKVPQLDTSKVTSMKYMFAGCQSLTAVEGIDFSGLTSELTNLFGYRNYLLPKITRFIVNGKINVDMSDEYSIKRLTEINYDSVKSILTAASLTDNTYAKTLAFNRKMTDSNGELKALVSSCTRKGWKITGLTLQ